MTFRLKFFFFIMRKNFCYNIQYSTGGPYCLYSLTVLYYNRMRIYSADSSVMDRSFLFPRTGSGSDPGATRQVF